MHKTRIIARENACPRTLNRIQFEGPEFDVIKEGTPLAYNREAVLVRSGEWLGWLPLDEIVMLDE